jgi:predicted DNA binding CopG/RHH family protein
MIVFGVLPFRGLYSENRHVYMKSYLKPSHHISIRLAANWINRQAKVKNSPEMMSGEGLPYQPNQA